MLLYALGNTMATVTIKAHFTLVSVLNERYINRLQHGLALRNAHAALYC